MKKVYEKPKFVFESFALSKNIATECAYTMNFNLEVCWVELESAWGTFKNFQHSPCIPAPGVDDKICYDNPVEGQNVFSS